MRIGIVAGEASGDQLGAGLLKALREQVPDLTAEGVGGPRMQAQGCRSLYPHAGLAVMGLVEVVGHLRELYRIRAGLADHFTRHRPDVFIGIDAPDFNLTLERTLRRRGIQTVHYVSPTVWAWRRYRMRKIKRAVDHMLVLFPFEARFYEQHRIPVTCVGHPLADAIPFEVDRAAARARLALPQGAEIVALLPGSRVTEVKALAGPFLEAAQRCSELRPGLRFVAPMANSAVGRIFERTLQQAGAAAPPVTVIDGDAQGAMAAADVVLAAGGTVVLEAMLLKRPVVMAYKVSPLTYRLARRLVGIETFSLPNLLAGRPLIPELIQDKASAEHLSREVLEYLRRPERARRLSEAFDGLHRTLRRGADRQAAAAILSRVQRPHR